MSWLISSIENNLGQTFMLYEIEKEIWDVLKQTNSNSENTIELFEIQSSLRDLRQGDMEVTQYFNLHVRFWQKLDLFEEIQWKCLEDNMRNKKIVEKECMFPFLAGLNKILDGVRERVLVTKSPS